MIYFNPSLFASYSFQPAVVNAAGPIAAFYRSAASGNGARAMQDLMEAPLTEEGLDLLEPLQAGFDFYHDGGRMEQALDSIRRNIREGWTKPAIISQIHALGRLFAEHHGDFQTLTELMRKKDDSLARKVFGEERPALAKARRFLSPMDGKVLKGDELLWSVLHFENDREVAQSVGVSSGTVGVYISRAQKTDPDVAEALRLRRFKQTCYLEVAGSRDSKYFNLTDDQTHLLGLTLILGAELLSREGFYDEESMLALVHTATMWGLDDVHFITGLPDHPFSYLARTTPNVLRDFWVFQELRRRMAA